ncbi:MAG TPA: HD domain-containing protein [Actinomycetota bacterium]|nr:HD domain-containing protein [Actinomycetota bacterium]
MAPDDLTSRLDFLLAADALKQVLRRNPLTDGSRRENTAEHSWHIALMALVLSEHAAEPVDLWRVVRMLLVHDLVEVHAGDTFVYDEAARLGKEAAEREAADRIFGMLPDPQRDELHALWEEFETADTPEARYARAVDRLSPLLLNHASGPGNAWLAHGVTADRVLARNEPIGEALPEVWEEAKRRVSDAVDRGFLDPTPGAAGPDG